MAGSTPVATSKMIFLFLLLLMTSEARCQEQCLVLDMKYVSTQGCTCICEDVDGTIYEGDICTC